MKKTDTVSQMEGCIIKHDLNRLQGQGQSAQEMYVTQWMALCEEGGGLSCSNSVINGVKLESPLKQKFVLSSHTLR